MSSQVLVDPPPGPALGASRARVLGLLRAAESPVSAHDVAARTGLHTNTARFHLDGLVDAGLAERGNSGAGRPGRPRVVYQPTSTEPTTGQRSYRLLAEMLTSLVSGAVDEPETAAVQAGRAWGRYLVERPAPSETVDASDALDRMTRMLTNAGFALDPVAETDAPVLALRQCPFREIAANHRNVVCALHLGMLQGALDEVRAPLTTERLEPFVEPSLCLAHLYRTDVEPNDSPTAHQPAPTIPTTVGPQAGEHGHRSAPRRRSSRRG